MAYLTEQEIAARVIVLEQQAQQLTNDIRVLFQDIVESIRSDGVE